MSCIKDQVGHNFILGINIDNFFVCEVKTTGNQCNKKLRVKHFIFLHCFLRKVIMTSLECNGSLV